MEDGRQDLRQHETPDEPFQVPEVTKVLATNPFGWSEDALAYSAESRARLTEALLGVRPRLLVHGHMHVGGQVTVSLPNSAREVTIWSLSRDLEVENLRFLDLDTLKETSR